MNLKKLYNLKLVDYKLNGVRDSPDKLLAMLLLPQKDNFLPLMVSSGEFYNKYKKEIDVKIERVIRDFEITNAEIVTYIEDKGVMCQNFEHDKIWFVFCEGFDTMHWGLMYRKNKSPEQIYAEAYGSDELDDINELSIRYKKLLESSSNSSVIMLPSREEQFNVEKDWQTVEPNGFIENYCLTKEEVRKIKMLRRQKNK
jgi:hypothetical protein